LIRAGNGVCPSQVKGSDQLKAGLFQRAARGDVDSHCLGEDALNAEIGEGFVLVKKSGQDLVLDYAARRGIDRSAGT
jgi:hypothetical protein